MAKEKIIVKDSKNGFKIDFAALKRSFDKQVFTIITIVGLLLMVVMYVYVYMDYQEKTKQVEISNNERKVLIDQLEEYYINIDNYREEIELIKTTIQEQMQKYPADTKEEDILMFAVEMQEKNEVEFSGIQMQEKEGVYTVPQNMIQMADIEGYDSDITFAMKKSTFTNMTNYDNLKGCVAQIFDSPNRIGINKIIYVKSPETGLLSGTLDLSFYSAAGTDKEYVAPDMAEYISGTSDLFKSDKVVNNYEPVENNKKTQNETSDEESDDAAESEDTAEDTESEE